MKGIIVQDYIIYLKHFFGSITSIHLYICTLQCFAKRKCSLSQTKTNAEANEYAGSNVNNTWSSCELFSTCSVVVMINDVRAFFEYRGSKLPDTALSLGCNSEHFYRCDLGGKRLRGSRKITKRQHKKNVDTGGTGIAQSNGI